MVGVRGFVAKVELFFNSTVILNVFCNGLPNDTKPDSIGIVILVVVLKFMHPIAT